MKTILIIEDEPQVRENIQEILEFSDFATLIAPNGQIGLEIAKNQLPDLIICDIMMPELDGFSVLSALRQNETTINIPLIFVTAKAERSDFRQGMNFGADDYLTKPFTPEELLNAIASRLDKHALIERHSEAKLDELRMNIAHSLPHEMNTPLNGILGMSQLLIECCDIMPGSEEIEIAKSIYTSANRLHRLTQRFLLYSELELISKNSKKILKIKEKTDKCFSDQIIQQTSLAKARDVHREKDLKLKLQAFPVQISAEKLSIIIEELLDNAFKFSLPGSEVQVISHIDNHQFKLNVIDNGKGITGQEIERIGAFIQFNRKLYEQQGSGLGLAIVQRMVNIYGGELTIDSVPQQGTNISVCFPC